MLKRPERKAIFISWIDFSRRIASMNEHFDFEVHYFPSPVTAKWLKPFGYVSQAFKTARVVLAVRPREVWLHCPPSFLPLLALALRPLAGRYRIVADFHSGVFSARWRWVPGTVWAANRCDLVLTHNAEGHAEALAHGVRPERVIMLEDPPPARLAPPPAAAPAARYVLVPCSFSPDEPIPTLLEAARLAPELNILVTGSLRRARPLGFTANVPPNLRFTDYLPLEEFERLLLGASVVLGLTSVEGIQLSVANEALGADRPLVLSDTRILRAMFGEAALFARNTPEDIAARLREAMARREDLERRSAALKLRRQQEWRVPAASVARMLS